MARRNDPTLGAAFELAIFTNRWAQMESYGFTRTATGWDVRFAGIGGPCDKQGRPYLFDNLRHDGVEHPRSLGERLEFLWDEARERRMTTRDVQSAFTALGKWLQKVEASMPSAGFWGHYKHKHPALERSGRRVAKRRPTTS